MKASKLFISVAAAAAVVSAIGIAYAQTAAGTAPGPGPETRVPGQPADPSLTQQPAAGTMYQPSNTAPSGVNRGSTSGSMGDSTGTSTSDTINNSTRSSNRGMADNSTGLSNDGSTMVERSARADRN